MSRKGERTAAEREAARLERARRRAEREGRPWPEEGVDPAPPPAAEDPAAFDAGSPAEAAPPFGEPDGGSDAGMPPGASPADADAAFDAGAAADADVPFDAHAAGGSAGDPGVPFDAHAAGGSAGDADVPFDANAAGGSAGDPGVPFDAHAAGGSAGGGSFDADALAHRPADPTHDAAPWGAGGDDFGHDPQATQQWDVAVDWSDEHVAVGHAGGSDAPAGGSADPDATGDHAASADDRHATGAHAAAPSEVPLGTRRVSRRDRPAARPGRGGRRARVRRPGELGPPRRRTTLGGRIAGVLIVVLVVALGWFLNALFQPFGGDGEGTGRVVVRIPEGSDAGSIGSLLADRGVVDSGFFFNLRATIGGDRGDLKSGRFTLRRGMSYGAALSALTSTPAAAEAPPTVTVTLPEGRSRRETVPVARRAGLRGDYLAATRRSSALDPRRYGAPAGATLEGFLFPATYELPARARVQRLVRDQLRAFRQNFGTVDLRYARSRNLTAYDVLTIASMVEREVSVPRERPLVAAVIYNRLREGIPLGIDATLRYETSNWTRPLRQSTLDGDTPFNTRIRPGLPPGPIGSPGLDSIRAAARPARVDYTYYVVDPCTRGEHAFARTYDEHLANVARYDRARAAAGGDGLRC